MRAVAGKLLLLWLGLGLAAVAVPSGAEARLLPAGEQEGTFAFQTNGRVLWYRNPPGKVLVSLCDFTGKELHQTTTGEDGTYEFRHDLPPGSYRIRADVEPEHRDYFWPDTSHPFSISKNGDCTSSHAELFLTEKMEILGPLQDEVVTDPQPVLRWKAVPQAREYRVYLRQWDPRAREFKELGKPVLTNLTYYQLPKPLKHDSIVIWSVFAHNHFGERFAGWRESRFLTPAGARMLERDLNSGELITAIGQEENLIGKPWLGVSISSTDPNAGALPTYAQRNGSFANSPYQPKDDDGIYVHTVGPQTPASAGGIQPGDIILRYEGIRVFRVDEFLQLVQYSSIGSEVELDILRGRQKKSLKVEVGPRP